MQHLAPCRVSVAPKGLTEFLSPFSATLTKNAGVPVLHLPPHLHSLLGNTGPVQRASRFRFRPVGGWPHRVSHKSLRCSYAGAELRCEVALFQRLGGQSYSNLCSARRRGKKRNANPLSAMVLAVNFDCLMVDMMA